MPAFGDNKNVYCYLDDLYIYLRARAVGAIPRGRPPKKADKPQAAKDARSVLHGWMSYDRPADASRSGAWCWRSLAHGAGCRRQRSRRARVSARRENWSIPTYCASAPIRRTCRSSDESGEGFENKLAELVAAKTGRKSVAYTWFPMVMGFVRNTLRANRCDIIMGYAAG